jgi:segregation and condensation protein A
MTAPTLSFPRFEGPLDLLLALVRKSEVDITAIPIARITRQYLDYLESAAALDLDLGAEFAYMAATLIQIKSRLLLPPDPEIARREPDPARELVRQLMEHDQLRHAAEFLDQQLEVTGATWTKGSIAEFQAPAAEDDDLARHPGSMNLLELLRLARQAVETARAHDLLQLDIPQITVAEMMAWLSERLAALSPAERLSAEPLFANQPGPGRGVALFLAMLELARAGSVSLEQQGLFTPIFLTRTCLP